MEKAIFPERLLIWFYVPGSSAVNVIIDSSLFFLIFVHIVSYSDFVEYSTLRKKPPNAEKIAFYGGVDDSI